MVKDRPNSASFGCGGSQGDFDLFYDEVSGKGYIVNTYYSHFCIEELDATFTAGTNKTTLQRRGPFVGNPLWRLLSGDMCDIEQCPDKKNFILKCRYHVKSKSFKRASCAGLSIDGHMQGPELVNAKILQS